MRIAVIVAEVVLAAALLAGVGFGVHSFIQAEASKRAELRAEMAQLRDQQREVLYHAVRMRGDLKRLERRQRALELRFKAV